MHREPKTIMAQRMLAQRRMMEAAGYDVPRRCGTHVPRPRLWLRYAIALDMLSQALGISAEQAAQDVEYRLAKLDRGYPKCNLAQSRVSHEPLRDNHGRVVCPFCASVLDLDLDLREFRWIGDEAAVGLEPLDFQVNAQDNPQDILNSCV